MTELKLDIKQQENKSELIYYLECCEKLWLMTNLNKENHFCKINNNIIILINDKG